MVMLPNPQLAVVDSQKLVAYVLNQHHDRGKHKARLFASLLNITVDDAPELEAALHDAVHHYPAIQIQADIYGVQYRLDFELKRGERQAMLRSFWIVRTSEDFARLVSVFPISN